VADLFVREIGQGPRVLLLHGAVLVGELTWRAELPLAERWTLVIVERAGYGRSRISAGEDLDTDATSIADLLDEPAHVVGQSSGAVAAMLTAARRPAGVLSLTLSEPSAFQVATDSPDARRMAQELETHLRAGPSDTEWLSDFGRIVGARVKVSDPLPPELADGVRALRAVRRLPWEGDLPIAEIASAPFPKLVISAGHSRAFDAVCDALTEQLAAQRAPASSAQDIPRRTQASPSTRLSRPSCSLPAPRAARGALVQHRERAA
jgi:pimeloyl-ACP methyl ester carboxylesterase